MTSCTGRGGDDDLDGGSGTDSLLGDGGKDHLVGGPGGTSVSDRGDVLSGGAGDEDHADYSGHTPGVSIKLNDEADDGTSLENDNVKLDVEHVTGTSGADWLYGSFMADELDGKAGNDYLYGNEGNDTLRGGDGDDKLAGDTGKPFGSDGDDILYGDAGIDDVRGEGGVDVLFGGADRDEIFGGPENDRINSIDKLDDGTVDCGPGDDYAGTDAIDDQVAACETVSRY